jgi:hypothetical protein
MDSDDNLIPFKARPSPIRSIARMPGARRECRHVETLLDPGRRCLACKECGAILDPYDYLTQILKQGEWYDKWFEEQKSKAAAEAVRLKALQREAAKLTRQVESLRQGMAALERQGRMDCGLAESEIAKMRAKLK